MSKQPQSPPVRGYWYEEPHGPRPTPPPPPPAPPGSIVPGPDPRLLQAISDLEQRVRRIELLVDPE